MSSGGSKKGAPSRRSVRVVSNGSNGFLVFQPFRIDVGGERLWSNNKAVPLPARQFALLVYLAERSQRLVTQRELLERVWGQTVMSESLIRTAIRSLRRVLGNEAIETVIGRGYRFAPTVTRVPGKFRNRSSAEGSPRRPGSDVDSQVATLRSLLRAMADVIYHGLDTKNRSGRPSR